MINIQSWILGSDPLGAVADAIGLASDSHVHGSMWCCRFAHERLSPICFAQSDGALVDACCAGDFGGVVVLASLD
jgi:hypothetical protein